VETLRKEIIADPSIYKKQEDIEEEEQKIQEEKKKAQQEQNAKEEHAKKTKAAKKKHKKKKHKRRSKSGEEWLIYTEKQNIMIMLRSIFPIPEKFGTALKNSYDHILTKRNNGRILYDLDFKQALNFFGFMYKFGIIKKEEEEYSVNVKGKRFEIEDAVWENDIVNHPVYATFLKAQNTAFEEVYNSKLEVAKKMDSYTEELKSMLSTLNARAEFKDKYFWKVFRNNSKGFEQKMNKEFREGYCKSRFPSESKDKETCVVNEKDRNAFVGFFDDLIPTISDAAFDEYIYKNPTDALKKRKMYDSVKKEFLSENLTYDPKTDDFEILWKGNFTQANEVDLIGALLVELKNRETITGLIRSVQKQSSAYAGTTNKRNAEIIADRILEKLKLLTGSGHTKETAKEDANTILSMQADIEYYKSLGVSRSASADTIIGSNYEEMVSKLTKLALKIKATGIVHQFLTENKPMNLKNNNDNASEKQKDNATKQDIVKYIEQNYPTEFNMDIQLSNSVNDIYEPKRRTSNKQLYCLLRNIKTGVKPPECGEINTAAIKQIYDYYMAEYPDRSGFNEIEPYLYTGVDQVFSTDSSDSKKKKTVTSKSQEIYVRLELVDAEQMKKTNRAQCSLYDKIVSEQYKYLTDKRYTDGTVLSTYRNLDFLSNPLIDSAMATAAAKTQGKMAAGSSYTRRVHDTIQSKRTLRRR
jgi:hypothetical protein